MFVWRPRQGHLWVGSTGAEPRSTQVHNGLPRAPGGSDVKLNRPASLETFSQHLLGPGKHAEDPLFKADKLNHGPGVISFFPPAGIFKMVFYVQIWI